MAERWPGQRRHRDDKAGGKVAATPSDAGSSKIRWPAVDRREVAATRVAKVALVARPKSFPVGTAGGAGKPRLFPGGASLRRISLKETQKKHTAKRHV